MKLRFLTLAVVMVATAAVAGPAKGKDFVATSFEELKWNPMDPKQPDGVQIAVVNGDPMKGASSFYLKIPANSPPNVHSHTGDYQTIVVKGQSKHWVEGKESEAKTLSAGGWWWQPGKQVHGDQCVSAEPCIAFITMTQKFDYQPSKKAMEAAKAAEKGAEKPADKAMEKPADKPADKHTGHTETKK